MKCCYSEVYFAGIPSLGYDFILDLSQMELCKHLSRKVSWQHKSLKPASLDIIQSTYGFIIISISRWLTFLSTLKCTCKCTKIRQHYQWPFGLLPALVRGGGEFRTVNMIGHILFVSANSVFGLERRIETVNLDLQAFTKQNNIALCILFCQLSRV